MSARNKFWRFRAAADNPKSADLLLYGPISETSWFGDEISPKQFAEDLKALGDIDVLNVYINSPGGDVFAAQAIHSQLKRHKAHVNVYIDGLAASMASVVAMAGDTIYMPANAMMMIHNPWTVAVGNAADFRALADTLDEIRQSIVAAYRERTGLSDDEIIAMMDAETWMTAEEAVERGFADRIEESKRIAASLRGNELLVGGVSFDVSRFAAFPRDRFPQAQAEPVVDRPLEVTTELELTVEILAEQYPDIYAEAKKAGYQEGYEAGVQAERARHKAIDDLAVPGAEDIINRAKYETGATAEQVAVEIVKAEKAKGARYLQQVQADAAPLHEIKPDAPPDMGAAEKEAIKAAFVKGVSEKRRR